MHYYQFNISDFSQSTKHLTLIEKAVYRELIDLYYDKEKPLINDPKELARLISARDNVTTVEQTLNEFFTLVDDCWVNDRCEEVISEYQSKIQGASKAGKASAKARAAKLETSSDVTTVEQTLNDSSTNQELLTNNYKPITINQEPITKEIITKEKIPYSAIAESYNANFANLTGNSEVRINELSDKRKIAIKKMWFISDESRSLQYWTEYFLYCSNIPNMQSTAERSGKWASWNPNFDYIMRRDTFDKAREENL